MSIITESDKQVLEEYKQQQLQDFFEYSKKSKSENSIRAYRFAWRKFVGWCGEYGYDPFFPTASSYELLVGLFVCSMAKERQLKSASLTAYLAGIKHFYAEKGIALDTKHREIRNAMSGIRRDLGIKQEQKTPLTTENIKLLIESIGKQFHPIDIRDKAMILVGFTGAFRRSELVGIDLEHLSFALKGVSIFVPMSKVDQEAQGRIVDIPFSSNEQYCPVRALQAWLECAKLNEGPVFLRVNKSGIVSRERLGGRSVALMLKKRCKPFGFSDDISGHSLRAGHVTSSIKRGTSEMLIMRQTGHKNINTLRKYERLHREFEANSAAKIGL